MYECHHIAVKIMKVQNMKNSKYSISFILGKEKLMHDQQNMYEKETFISMIIHLYILRVEIFE